MGTYSSVIAAPEERHEKGQHTKLVNFIEDQRKNGTHYDDHKEAYDTLLSAKFVHKLPLKTRSSHFPEAKRYSHQGPKELLVFISSVDFDSITHQIDEHR